MNLCQPALAILLVAVAGSIYHLLAQDMRGLLWWLMVGIAGTGVFQTLCFSGVEPLAWILMLIPVLIVCFFLAVALFASSMRIHSTYAVPCAFCTESPTP